MTLRPAVDEDRDFLRRLYATTRDRELAAVGWSAERKHAFLHQQFEAQWNHYSTHWAAASNSIVLVGGEPVGRFLVDRSGADNVLVDLALLPAFRGIGIGTRLVSALIAESRLARRRIVGHVERWNPAQRLWARLGFRIVDDRNVYLAIVWEPGCTPPAEVGSGYGWGTASDKEFAVKPIIKKVNLAASFARFSDHWSPKIAGDINDMQLKLVKLQGEFPWHYHTAEDELFLVFRGRLLMRFRDGEVSIEPGEFLIVPHGVEHQPFAEVECEVVLLEPKTTVNTGNVVNERTVADLERLP